MKKIFIITNLFFLLAVIACQDKTIYHSYQPVSPTGWYRNDTLIYTLKNVSSPNDFLKFNIGIRHEDSYPYRDIWLTANQDTFHFYLADSTGEWKGKGIGNLKQIVFPTNLRFQQQDSIIRIKLNHIMQEKLLFGICDIGLHVEQISE